MQTMPDVVVGKLWPADRVVVGTRVSKWIRKCLLEHAPHVVMNKAGKHGIKSTAKKFASDCARFLKQTVAVHIVGAFSWDGEDHLKADFGKVVVPGLKRVSKTL
eukprot:3030620-Rhodomonas_salina.1